MFRYSRFVKRYGPRGNAGAPSGVDACLRTSSARTVSPLLSSQPTLGALPLPATWPVHRARRCLRAYGQPGVADDEPVGREPDVRAERPCGEAHEPIAQRVITLR